MPLVATEHIPGARTRVIPVYVQHGIAGVLVVAGVTIARWAEVPSIIHNIGDGAPMVIALFLVFACALALLKFPLTDQISVNLAVAAYIAMFPILGLVLSVWIAVVSTIAQRIAGMLQLGPTKVDMRDRALEWARTFSLFGTYGIPVTLCTLLYEWSGGEVPLQRPGVIAAARVVFCGIVMVISNNLIVARVERAFGYSPSTSLKLGVIDSSIYIIAIPYSILTGFATVAVGWGGLLAGAFTGVLVNVVCRKLASIGSESEELIGRLTSLTNIGKSISLSYTTDELLSTIYSECQSVIDTSIFSIALLDERTNELSFELNVERGKKVEKSRMPIGEGLNSWVALNRKPLLLGSSREEERVGVHHVEDNMSTESWLGAPMIARRHVVGVISVQSFAKNAFREDDLLMLTAIANQAAVAIENAQLYKHLERMNAELEERVSERTNALREANLRLMAADRTKNQFLASMSHELRTPLNAIIGFSTILLENTRDLLQPRFYKFLENIRTAGSHLLDLINDILDLAKIESGKLDLRFETFDLHETIGTVERVIKGMAAERHVTVITHIDEGVTSARLDEGRLKQILLNLLSNAVKFSNHSGYVYLTVKQLAASESPLICETIRIDVADSGIGIPGDELSLIFDEFYQVTTSRRQKGGSGLGLSLTKNFVEMHHGTISVTSEPGRGATFTIFLPRVAEVSEISKAQRAVRSATEQ